MSDWARPLGADGKIKTQTVVLIDQTHFDELVRQTYARPYNYQQQGDFAGQDTIWAFEVPASREEWGDVFVDFDEWKNVDPSPQNGEREWERNLRWEREYYPCFSDVVNDLHSLGLINAGSYYMHVWW